MFTIQLARLGQTMEQGTLVRWCKQEGETIEIGEDLYEVESEKAIVPVQVTRRGRLVRHITGEGATIPVGTVLAVVADPGETLTESQIEATVLADSESRVGAEAAARGVPVAASGAAPPNVASGRALAAPKARALAAELGVDLQAVRGTGPDGLIMPDDIRAASRASNTAPVGAPAATAGSSARASVPADEAAGSRILRKVPLSPITRSMMSALEKGWQIPQFTQIALADASTLVRRKGSNDAGLSFMDFFLDALVAAARQVPEALVSVHGSEAWYHGDIDVTIALATDSGLLVPVLRNAAAMGIVERGKAWRALGEKGRAGKLAPADMSGGIIALSNLGSRGVDYGTPLLPPGHSLIAFIGSLETRALVVDGRLEARPSVYVCITYDHRVIDGALAARFTSAMRAALEADAVPG